MKIFKRKIDAHRFIDEVMLEKIEGMELFDRLAISYPKFTQWLEREYPGKKEWDQSSLEAAIEAWGIGSGKEYSKRVGYPERTCQRYAVKGEDYKTFCGRLVTCTDSADQLKKELDSGKRGNRPKKTPWTDPT